MLPTEFDAEVAKMGDGDGLSVCQWVRAQKLKDWSEFQRLLSAAIVAITRRGEWLPYDLVSRNCFHFARQVANEIHVQWAKAHPGEPPPALGVITGDVPCDGENRIEAWHALLIAWCIDAPYLAGAQDGQVMNQCRVGEIKAVEYVYI